MKPDITVVALNYNTRDLLASCLESLKENDGGLELQIIVVDNASQDGSADMVRQDYPEVLLVENEENLGSARGTNAGIRLASAPYVLILNPDTVVKPNALRSLFDHLAASPDVGIVGPRLVGEDGEFQQNCHYFTILKASYALLLLLTLAGKPGIESLGLHTNPGGDCDRAVEVDWVYTACALVRREVFDGVGLLDENLFFYGDDMDLCYRAHLEGWKTVFLPQAEIIHYGNRSGSQVFGELYSYGRVRARISSLDYFLRKHFGALHSYLIRGIMAIGSMALSAVLGLIWLAKKGDSEMKDRSSYAARLGLACLSSIVKERTPRVGERPQGGVRR